MLKIIQSGNSLPFSFPVDPSAEFMPGMIGQLGILGNNVICGVSDGTAPLGVIDDIKTKAFTQVSISEIVIAGPIAGVPGPVPGTLVTPNDVKMELEHAGVIANSFRSEIDCALIPVNGVVKFKAGTVLNMDSAGSGTPDSIRTIVSYVYYVPNVPGDDTTTASGKMTLWFQRFLGETDQFDTTQRYPINANLFVGADGKFTTRQPGENYPGVALVSGTPTSIMGTLQFIWL
jgi:hypothetical protein